MNLSIADMLYSAHLSVADTFSRNQSSQVMVKPLYFEALYSGHLYSAHTFSENEWCPLLRGFTVIVITPKQETGQKTITILATLTATLWVNMN